MNKPATDKKPKQSFSLSLKIIIAIVTLAIVPLLVFAGVLRFIVLDNIHNLIVAESDASFDRFFDSFARDSRDIPKAMADSSDLADALVNKDTAKIKSILNATLASYPNLDALEVGDANGNVIYRAHNPDKFGDNKADKTEYKVALRGTPQIGFWDKGGTGNIAYRTLYPVKKGGDVVGTILAGIQTHKFSEAIYQAEGTAFIFYDADMKVIENDIDGYVMPDGLKNKIMETKAKKGLEVRTTDIFSDQKANKWVFGVSLVYAPDGSFQGAYQVFTSAKQLVAAENKIAAIAIGTALAAFLVTVGAAFFAANRLTAPIDILRQGLERLRKGDRQTRIVINSNDELEETATILNSTLDEVLKYAQTDEEYKTLQKNLIELLEVSDALANGDFTKKAKVGEGQLGIIADAFNTIAASLRQSLNRVKELSEDMTDKVSQSNKGLETVVQSRELVLKQIQQTQEKATMLSSFSSQIADLSVALEGSFVIEAEKTRKSSMALAYSTEKIVGIKDTIQSNNKKLKKLGEDMLQIANHITSIQEITKKTNLIAINTAIEANSMGEAGKSFANVAVEIKKMAATNEESSKIIKESSDNMLKVIQQLTAAMENSITDLNISTNDTVGSIETVKSTLNSIVQNITKLQQIVMGSKEQSEYSSQVAEGLDGILHTAQDITNTFASTNAIISQMNTDIELISQSLAKFKV